MIWGCPALRAGRAIAQLAGLLGPAGFFALLQKPLVCRLRRPCYSPSADWRLSSRLLAEPP
ncbi:hypothetical protein SapgrDRAFT_0494 [Saprospira grandis DSM 2844]|uniref:Uncharacterized protein n=1 Tax=Saprospira grandis DSM 2844 TaxID=694433 RepID=J1I1U5_9BACT|nr:hypothetical protein SapgrDRAFT_0494 [Saprospira grandis DSM 2844]